MSIFFVSANTCSSVPVKDPLRVEKELNGSVLRFSCAVMNILEGAEVITCDGTSWSDSPPKCTRAYKTCSILQVTFSGRGARWPGG